MNSDWIPFDFIHLVGYFHKSRYNGIFMVITGLVWVQVLRRNGHWRDVTAASSFATGYYAEYPKRKQRRQGQHHDTFSSVSNNDAKHHRCKIAHHVHNTENIRHVYQCSLSCYDEYMCFYPLSLCNFTVGKQALYFTGIASSCAAFTSSQAQFDLTMANHWPCIFHE